MADLDRDPIDLHLDMVAAAMAEQARHLDVLFAEVRRLRTVVRASLALDAASTGPELIAAEAAWRDALAPYREADRG